MSERDRDRGRARRFPAWLASQLPGDHTVPAEQGTTAEQNQRFLLQVVQPALVGLMDGSVSTLAPIFATAYATHIPHTAFLVGVAAAVGAGISMGFAEALSDTGELTGRGHPIQRGAITGGATFLGGILHTLPFLLPTIQSALYLAYLVVGIELITIAVIRNRFFQMSMVRSVIQVVIGGALVFTAGVLIGNS
ncbi:MAG TPA: VIT1/CCC1 transporter family protein [Thermomicrobiaceae bacterium]|nr:VIT1/CCC1 transporter family protein [Thermomicrobiaceae bacterium]